MIRNTIFALIPAVLMYIKPVAGQLDNFYWSDFTKASNYESGKLTGNKYVYSIVKNSDFFYQPDWFKGTVTTLDGEIHSEISLRYDAFNDELVAYNTHVKGLFVVDKYTVSTFTVDVPGKGKQIFRKASLDLMGKREHYFEVLYEGGVTLMRRNRIVERKVSLYKNKYGKLDNRSYDLMLQNFVLLNDQTVRRIFPGRKSVINLFPDRKKDLRRLFRRNHIQDYSIEGLPRIVMLLDIEGYFSNEHQKLQGL